MSAAASSEEQFLCSICLEVFSEPVSTPCGHNFCKHCISQHWDTSCRCFCPLCKEDFSTRPQLKQNIFISEMVSHFKLDAKVQSQKVSKPVDVQCDTCSEPKLKAVKSCLVCLSSFCESHLQPHLTVSGLKRHQLMEPVDNLEEVRERRRAFLLHSQAQSQHMLEQRRLKVQEIQFCLELSETENHREVASGLQAFTVLMQSVQSHREHFLEQLQEKQRNNQRQAQELLQQLQQEICELENSSTEAQQCSLSKDPLDFLQHCPALPPAGLKDWNNVSFEPETCEGSAAIALFELEKSLNEEFKQLTSTLEMRRVQQFAVDVTLDPDTAHPGLVLSEDLKQVHCGDVKKELPYSPQRFDKCVNVLGKQSFSSGRFYFEVQVKGKTDWDLGVVQESISRKRNDALSPKNGYWTVILRNRDKYIALADPPVPLSLPRPPQKVGVFVDYGAGLVSFYDVDCADLLCSFTCCNFKGKLLLFFGPCINDGGKNSAPLIITDVLTRGRPMHWKVLESDL